MQGGIVRIISTKNSVPKLTQESQYQVVVKGGREFIVDWYGGYLDLKDAPRAGVILERVGHG